MKTLTTVLMFGGLLATTSATTTNTESTTSASASTTAATDGDPCPWCCPPWQCGINGPSFDGTTVSAPECSAD